MVTWLLQWSLLCLLASWSSGSLVEPSSPSWGQSAVRYTIFHLPAWTQVMIMVLLIQVVNKTRTNCYSGRDSTKLSVLIQTVIRCQKLFRHVTHNIPYSRKLLRENSTFANFAVCGYSRKFSSRNLGGGGVLWHGKSKKFAIVFFTKIVFFTNSQSFLPRKFPAIQYYYKSS